MSALIRCSVAALLFHALVVAQTSTGVVFMGFPQRRSVNTIGNNETEFLKEQDSKEYLCMISRKDGRYFWSSRNGKEMTKTISGAFVIFSAIDGSGYLKFSPQMKDLPLDYMEHLHDKLSTFTYWGKSLTYRE